MDGGSIHPHGKLDKVNLERRGDDRRGVVAAEYLWAPSFSLPHSPRQAVTGTDDVPDGPRNQRGWKCVRDDRIQPYNPDPAGTRPAARNTIAINCRTVSMRVAEAVTAR